MGVTGSFGDRMSGRRSWKMVNRSSDQRARENMRINLRMSKKRAGFGHADISHVHTTLHGIKSVAALAA